MNFFFLIFRNRFFAAHDLTNLVKSVPYALTAFFATFTAHLNSQPDPSLSFAFIAAVTNQDAAFSLGPVFFDFNTFQTCSRILSASPLSLNKLLLSYAISRSRTN